MWGRGGGWVEDHHNNIPVSLKSMETLYKLYVCSLFTTTTNQKAQWFKQVLFWSISIRTNSFGFMDCCVCTMFEFGLLCYYNIINSSGHNPRHNMWEMFVLPLFIQYLFVNWMDRHWRHSFTLISSWFVMKSEFLWCVLLKIKYASFLPFFQG